MTAARAYRLNRIATWLLIEGNPPNQDGITQLPMMPVADKRKQFLALFEAGKFEELLTQIEPCLVKAPFWLDGQCYVAKSLQTLGEKYQPAFDTVIREVQLFLNRCPGIEYLKFNDGTAFADEQTLLWINNEVSSVSDQSEAQDTPWTEPLKRAKALLASKKTKRRWNCFNKVFNNVISCAANGNGVMPLHIINQCW